MTDRRVFITGRSALTATGDTAEKTWNALLQGQSGIAPIEQWDMNNVSYQLGAELKDFNPAKMLPDRKLIKVVSKQDVMGINAAVQAVEDSGIITYRNDLDNKETFNEQTAVYVGSPGNKYFQQYDFLELMAKTQNNMHEFAQQLFDNVHPMWLLRILPNNVLAYTGITYGFKGPNHNITNHAISGIQAIIEAFHAISTGKAERAVVIAYDMGMEPQGLYYYDKLGVISQKHLKPFDIAQDGTILGEGAAALVLESETSVLARHASCYGEIIGGQSTSEASGLFSIQTEGAEIQRLITTTLNNCSLTAKDINLIVAHGNGNAKSDDSEAEALHTVFAEYAPAISAFKWSYGHTLCASGLLDTVFASYALERKIIPGIANFTKATYAAETLNISTHQRSLQENATALIINRGFASMNACLVVKSCA